MSVVPKIDLVIERLKYTSWTEGYRANSLHFLKSIKNQAKSRMTLSDKQMSAVTKLYKRIEKNIEKSKNSS